MSNIVDSLSHGGRGFIEAGDLAPIKARIPVMLALAATSDSADIQRMTRE